MLSLLVIRYTVPEASCVCNSLVAIYLAIPAIETAQAEEHLPWADLAAGIAGVRDFAFEEWIRACVKLSTTCCAIGYPDEFVGEMMPKDILKFLVNL